MHPAVLSAQPTTMVPYPVFQSPVNLRHLDYHPLMFPFHQQLALHAQSGTFQYSLSGLPFQGSPNVFEEQRSRATKTGSSFTIDAILSSKRNKQEILSPESSPVSRKVSNSHQRRHERVKNFSLPYGRSPTRPELSESPRSGCDLPISADNIEKKSGCNEWKSVRAKRIRTIFTPEQLERLETEFERQQYMVGTERYYLATELNLTEAQVKVWFQNRRIKWRKQTLEKQQAQLAASDVYHGVHSDSDVESADDLSANKDNDIEIPSVLNKD